MRRREPERIKSAAGPSGVGTPPRKKKEDFFLGGKPRGRFGIGDRKGTDGWGKSLWVKKRRLSREVGLGMERLHEEG